VHVALAELRIQPLNNSVLFLKVADIVLSSDDWRIAVVCDISGYYDTVSAIKTDLLTVERQRKEVTSVVELQQIYFFFQTLEFRLRTFNQLLPRLDRRRFSKYWRHRFKDVIRNCNDDRRSQASRCIYGTESRNSDIVHSLENKLTYVKKLDSLSVVNTDAIANFSSIVKENLMN